MWILRRFNMTKTAIWILAIAAAIPGASFGQTPDGTDINQAVPIYFGQTINDTVDVKTHLFQVYSVTLAKGQKFNATAAASAGLYLLLVSSDVHTLTGFRCGCLENDYGTGTSWNYQASTAGVYYLVVQANTAGTTYKLQITADTIIPIDKPVQAGCVTGQVDSITYSLQLIAAELPDEASIGGTKLCPGCAIHAPAYPLLAHKMETAMGQNVGVSACYDAAGNIFQIKLVHP
jgi:hypothetical protein